MLMTEDVDIHQVATLESVGQGLITWHRYLRRLRCIKTWSIGSRKMRIYETANERHIDDLELEHVLVV